jgi:hypothetical protein
MGAPSSGMEAADQPAAETLLSAFKTIGAAERRRHASLLNYWQSIRGDKEFPPLHDLDPLELSDAGPNSALLELISGGHDAEIRHLGEALRGDDWPEQIMDAPNPSILACIAKKLPIVAISRDFLAFEDEFSTAEGSTRCWVTLLPLSAGGAWVDYVYALVSFETVPAKGAAPARKATKKAEVEEAVAEVEVEEPIDEPVEEPADVEAEEPVEEPADVEAEEPVPEEIDDEIEQAADVLSEETEYAQAPPEEAEQPVEAVVEDEPIEPVAAAVAKAAPGFSKLFDSLAGLTGFYAQGVKVEPVIRDAPVASDEPVEQPAAKKQPAKEQAVEVEPAKQQAEEPTPALEGTLQNKLTDVRAKADEARMAKLRANAALYEGLGAAYDFALDAEEAPEEYLRLVEAKGLKIQLRSPMKPVVKLAFDGMCDDATIKQLEAVLAWAFAEELPRGSLAERIEATGGIARILSGDAPTS